MNKPLNRLFFYIFILFALLSGLFSLLLNQQLQRSLFDSHVEMVAMESETLVNGVRRDLHMGNIRYAWGNIFRATSLKNDVSFSIRDRENGDFLVNDIEVKQALQRLKTENWGELKKRRDSNIYVSSDKDYAKVVLDLEAANLRVEFIHNLEKINQQIRSILFSFYLFLFLIWLVLSSSLYLLKSRFLSALIKIENSLGAMLEGAPIELSDKELLEGHFAVGERVGALKRKFDQVLSQQKQHIQQKAKYELARRVAHDIRAPLSALNMLKPRLEKLELKETTLFGDALSRISNIADGLLAGKDTKKSLMTIPLHFLPLPLLHREGVENHIQLEFDFEKDLWVRVNPVEFGRVFSNLLSNAIESIPPGKKGIIRVTMAESNSKQVQLKIEDNGKGIDPADLLQLGKKEFTKGKQGGNGIGVYSAQQSLSEWQGHLQFESELDRGTTVTVSLPKAKPFSVFSLSLSFKDYSGLIVCDDHKSYYELLKKQFPFEKTLYFSSPDKLDISDLQQPLCFIDNHYSSEKALGIKTVLKIRQQTTAILFTEDWLDQELLSECEKHGILLFPKNLIPFARTVLDGGSKIIGTITFEKR